jgi:hypothetical protein
MIHGVVVDEHGKQIENAVVKLLIVRERFGSLILKPLMHTFTDKFGHFIFGPLIPSKNYVIFVWANTFHSGNIQCNNVKNKTIHEHEK